MEGAKMLNYLEFAHFRCFYIFDHRKRHTEFMSAFLEDLLCLIRVNNVPKRLFTLQSREFWEQAAPGFKAEPNRYKPSSK